MRSSMRSRFSTAVQSPDIAASASSCSRVGRPAHPTRSIRAAIHSVFILARTPGDVIGSSNAAPAILSRCVSMCAVIDVLADPIRVVCENPVNTHLSDEQFQQFVKARHTCRQLVCPKCIRMHFQTRLVSKHHEIGLNSRTSAIPPVRHQ